MFEKVFAAYLLWNFVVFVVYGIDKLKARAGAFRIPEKTLVALAAAFGALGAWAGMKIFRHKTQTPKFTILIPIFALLNLAIIFIILYLTDNMYIV